LSLNFNIILGMDTNIAIFNLPILSLSVNAESMFRYACFTTVLQEVLVGRQVAVY